LNKKTAFIIFWVLFVFGCCSIPTDVKVVPAQKHEELNLINKLENSSVALMSLNNEDKQYDLFCAGVFVSSNLILTARHCGEDFIPLPENSNIDLTKPITSTEELIKILNIINQSPDFEKMIGVELGFKTFNEIDQKFTEEKKPKMAKIIKYDVKNDLLLLQTINYESNNFVSIAKNKGTIGEKIHIIGHPAGVEFTYFTGIVSGFLKEPETERNYLHVTAPIFMGNSGGGAFDEDGKLIGICSAFKPMVPSMAFFVGSEEINQFLFKN